MPPEWAHHRATWLSWPHKLESWPGKFDPVPAVFAEIAAKLSLSEAVHVNVVDARMEDEVHRLFAAVPDVAGRHDRLHVHQIPTDDAWCRDYGPNYVERYLGETTDQVILNWRYNAWGGKYEPYDRDEAVTPAIAAMQQLPLVSIPMVLEGGSIDVNGEGLLLTSEACLLNPNRNPSMGKREIEAMLGTYLGIEKVLWLGDGIVGDDTDGHVDDMARFVARNVVVAAYEEDPADDNHHQLRDNLHRLRSFTGLDGRLLDVVTLPMPAPVYYDGERLPASYANFYIANSLVLVPTYRCANDRVAIDILQDLFPDRDVVGVDCTDLVWGLGAIHCITHEEPAL